MKLSTLFYTVILVSGLLISAQQAQAFFFDFDFSSDSGYDGWDSRYYYSRYQPYYHSNYNSYYQNRYNPYWNRWNQPYLNRWGQPYWNQPVGIDYSQQVDSSLNDSAISSAETSDIK